MEIKDPREQKIYKRQLKLDKYGGVSDSLTLPEGAVLGNYQVIVADKDEDRK